MNAKTELKLFAVDYEWRGQQYRTVVEAESAADAERIFRRDNPQADFLAAF